MLKIIVFDGGYGGEIFADHLEKELPIAKIIRVIDWKNSRQYLENPKKARLAAEKALKPYMGRADLIIIANYLLTITSIRYFERKYKGQKFLGLELPRMDTFVKRKTAIFTTKAVTKTIDYYSYIFHLKRKADTFCLDHWVELIDDGELTEQIIYRDIERFYLKYRYKPAEIIIACSQFCDTMPMLKSVLSKNLKIHDGFDDTINKACKILKIRGGTGKKKK
ncbi:hypothetical protein J6S55_01040 [Candidatus Saccharibacteria bacterium]|nr:hypothetical protein [Candidatus Saccharibacteria bacterium]